MQAVIDFYGPVDFTARLLALLICDEQRRRERSPLTYLTPDCLPTLILQGEDDMAVEVSQSQMLADRLAELGVAHELVILPDTDHGFTIDPPAGDLGPTILSFLDRSLNAGGDRA